MPQTFRIAAFALNLGALSLGTLSLGALAVPATLASTGAALAQAGNDQGAPQQVALTQKQIDGLIAAQAEMSKLQAPAQDDRQQGNDQQQIDPKLQAKVEAIAKKNGFSGLEQYEAVASSAGIVMGGIDPQTKSYVGAAAVIKKQIAQVQADKTMPAKEKKQALQELKEAMASSASMKPPAGNIDIVTKNFDKLSQAFQGGGNGGD